MENMGSPKEASPVRNNKPPNTPSRDARKFPSEQSTSSDLLTCHDRATSRKYATGCKT